MSAAESASEAPAATWIAAVGGSDSTWRAGWPAEAVGGRVIRVPNTSEDLERTFLWPNTDTEFPWRVRMIDENGDGHLVSTAKGWKRTAGKRLRLRSMIPEFTALDGEPVVFSRPCPARMKIGEFLRGQGVRTLSESDDNYFASGKHNIFLRLQGSDDLRMQHALAMASMGGAVFSTEWLRDRYVKEFRKRFHVKGIAERRWMPDLYVCRNHVPSWHWPEPDLSYDGPLRFGFMGSQSHIWDVGRLAFASFHAAHTLGCRTTFIGYSPADPTPEAPETITIDGVETPTRSEESLSISRRWQTVVDEHVRWVDPLTFKRGGLPLDIALAPLLRNGFNDGRSDIKNVEAVIAGAAPVCSRHPVFKAGGWKHEVNCLMGSTDLQLAEQVVRLIRDPVLRRDLVTAGREMVRNERGEKQMRAEWGEALGL